MIPNPITVSLSPDRLSLARRLQADIELKFSWEHRNLLIGERDLSTHLSDTDVPTDRIASVHIPPGTETRGDAVGMALTEANRGTIADFVHSQLAAVPNAPLVAHPPKQFDYAEFRDLLASLLDITGRRIAVENTSVESHWYTPEQIAFFAYLAQEERRLADCRLTVDSAHLPAASGTEPVIDSNVHELESKLDPSTRRQSSFFRDYLAEHAPDEDFLADQSPYTPLLKTLSLTGEAVGEIHLNEPVSDTVPEIDPHDGDLVLDRVLHIARKNGTRLVVEPSSKLLGQPEDLRKRIEALEEKIKTLE